MIAQPIRDHLEGHGSVQAAIDRAIHLAHAAGRERFDHFVGSKSDAAIQWHVNLLTRKFRNEREL
jgi:hypothetical protein